MRAVHAHLSICTQKCGIHVMKQYRNSISFNLGLYGKWAWQAHFWFPTFTLLSHDTTSFLHFIFMTYYVLKCSKMVDFYGFVVHNFFVYNSILPIFNTKQILYKKNIPAQFSFPSSSGATSIVLSTNRRTDIARIQNIYTCWGLRRIFLHVTNEITNPIYHHNILMVAIKKKCFNITGK